MLPVHHHLYDTKLLMLAVPACAMLWAEGGRTGRLALLVTGAGFMLTGDISWTMIFWFVNHLHLPAAGARGWILTALRVFPAPLILLAMSVFYLWATPATPAPGMMEKARARQLKIDAGQPREGLLASWARKSAHLSGPSCNFAAVSL
jgi:hypothetical protein